MPAFQSRESEDRFITAMEQIGNELAGLHSAIGNGVAQAIREFAHDYLTSNRSMHAESMAWARQIREEDRPQTLPTAADVVGGITEAYGLNPSEPRVDLEVADSVLRQLVRWEQVLRDGQVWIRLRHPFVRGTEISCQECTNWFDTESDVASRSSGWPMPPNWMTRTTFFEGPGRNTVYTDMRSNVRSNRDPQDIFAMTQYAHRVEVFCSPQCIDRWEGRSR